MFGEMTLGQVQVLVAEGKARGRTVPGGAEGARRYVRIMKGEE